MGTQKERQSRRNNQERRQSIKSISEKLRLRQPRSSKNLHRRFRPQERIQEKLSFCLRQLRKSSRLTMGTT